MGTQAHLVINIVTLLHPYVKTKSEVDLNAEDTSEYYTKYVIYASASKMLLYQLNLNCDLSVSY